MLRDVQDLDSFTVAKAIVIGLAVLFGGAVIAFMFLFLFLTPIGI